MTNRLPNATLALAATTALAGLPAATSSAAEIDTSDIGGARRIAVFPDGHLAAVGDSFATFRSYLRIYASTGGATTITPIELDTSPAAGFNMNPDVTVTGDTTLLASWDQRAGGSHTVYARAFTVAGQPGGDIFQLSEPGTDCQFPVLTSNTAGDYAAFWLNRSHGFVEGRLPGGAEGHNNFWDFGAGSNVVVVPDASLSAHRKLSLASSYTNSFSGHGFVTVNHLRADGWNERSVALDLTPDDESYHPGAASGEGDELGRFAVAWSRAFPDDTFEVYLRTFKTDGTPDSPVVEVTAGGAQGRSPHVSVDANGRGLVAWHPAASGTARLYYATFNLGPDPSPSAAEMVVPVPDATIVDVAINTAGHNYIAWGGGGQHKISNASTSIGPSSPPANPGTFSGWQASQFPDPGAPEAAAGADPDGDRLPNLVEFTLGTPATSASAVPVPDRSQGELVVWRLPHNTAATGVVISAQTSAGAGDPWSSAGVTVDTTTHPGTILVTAPASPSGTTLIRLQASTLP